jgi:hypothetical protein
MMPASEQNGKYFHCQTLISNWHKKDKDNSRHNQDLFRNAAQRSGTLAFSLVHYSILVVLYPFCGCRGEKRSLSIRPIFGNLFSRHWPSHA